MVEKTTEKLLEEISGKFDTLIAVMIIQGKSTDDQISILKGMNYSWSEIGKFVGMDSDAARMRYSRKRV